MIVHTLKLCTGVAGPEQSMVLLKKDSRWQQKHEKLEWLHVVHTHRTVFHKEVLHFQYSNLYFRLSTILIVMLFQWMPKS